MAWKMSTILLPLLCVVWQGIVGSEAQETYQVPLVPVTTFPFESIYQYPLEVNRIKENGTHVFLPANEKLFSKFYISLSSEKEKLFGISEQAFIDSGNDAARAGATVGTNDHLAFVKVEGPWSDGATEEMEERNGFSGMGNMPPMDQMPMEFRLQNLKMKIGYLLQWYNLANITGLTSGQITNPAQFSELGKAEYNAQSALLEKKLLAEMAAFSSGLSHTDYHQLDKSAVACFHFNPAGSEMTTGNDDKRGWWLPLERNLVAWRAIGYQTPLSKLMTPTGLMSMTIESGNLNMVFLGFQQWRTDIDGPDFNNMRLEMFPPTGIPDIRPQAPAVPMEPYASAIRGVLKGLPKDDNLPWMDREQLCPSDFFDASFKQLTKACGYPMKATEKCAAMLANFYPCFNYFLRPSEKHNHGMDTIVDLITIVHIMSESEHWYWRHMAMDKPMGWDGAYSQALGLLGLDI